MMIELAMMTLMTTAAPLNAKAAQLSGWLRIDGQAPVVNERACEFNSDVLASVVFVDLESGAAVERVDITCASGTLKFETPLAPGKYRAVVWPALDATNLVARPYAFDETIQVAAGRNVITLEELTVPVRASLHADCSVSGTAVLFDTQEPFSQPVKAQCTNNTLHFSARLPNGTYEVHLENGDSSRTLAGTLEVKRSAVALIDLDGERLVMR